MPAPPQNGWMSSRRCHASSIVDLRTSAFSTSRCSTGSSSLVSSAIRSAGASVSRTIRPLSVSNRVANVYFVPFFSTKEAMRSWSCFTAAAADGEASNLGRARSGSVSVGLVGATVVFLSSPSAAPACAGAVARMATSASRASAIAARTLRVLVKMCCIWGSSGKWGRITTRK